MLFTVEYLSANSAYGGRPRIKQKKMLIFEATTHSQTHTNYVKLNKHTPYARFSLKFLIVGHRSIFTCFTKRRPFIFFFIFLSKNTATPPILSIFVRPRTRTNLPHDRRSRFFFFNALIK